MESETAILAATIDLMIEGGVRDMTMDAIAMRAGVSKATLYKWWPGKLHLALDALLVHGRVRAPVPNTGSALQDFTLNAQGIARFYADPRIGPCIMQLWGEALTSRDTLAIYRERFLNPRRAGLHVVYERGVARGDIDGRIDVELALDMIYGPFLFRLLTGHGPVNDDEIDRIVRTAFSGLTPS